MSAREIISQVLDSAYGPEHAQDIINDLTTAGYRITPAGRAALKDTRP